MKQLTRRATLGILMVGVVVGLAFLAFLLAGVWGDSASAEPVPTVGVDTNPYATPANTATSLGSIEACMTAVSTPYDDDGDTVADEDPLDYLDNDGDTLTDEDLPGQMVVIDVYIKDVPPLRGFHAAFNYNPAVLNVVKKDILQFLAASPGSSLLDMSDGVPDSDGDYGAGAFDTMGPHESGEGPHPASGGQRRQPGRPHLREPVGPRGRLHPAERPVRLLHRACLQRPDSSGYPSTR
jgi:hypothetical protein